MRSNTLVLGDPLNDFTAIKLRKLDVCWIPFVLCKIPWFIGRSLIYSHLLDVAVTIVGNINSHHYVGAWTRRPNSFFRIDDGLHPPFPPYDVLQLLFQLLIRIDSESDISLVKMGKRHVKVSSQPFPLSCPLEVAVRTENEWLCS